MTPEQIARAFGCPARCAEVMATNPTPMHRAIMELGPGKAPSDPSTTIGNIQTCWSLDGKRANRLDLMVAAGAQEAL